MTIRRGSAVAGALLLLVMLTVAGTVAWEPHRYHESGLRSARELSFKLVRTLVTPGMRRDVVVGLLKQGQLGYTAHTTYDATDSGSVYQFFVLVDRASSGVFYCSYLDHSVEIKFRPVQPHKDGQMELDSDVVEAVQPFEQLIDCL